MPELAEVEKYRVAAERALHRPIVDVDAADAWYLKRGLDEKTVRKTLIGHSFAAARRLGKLLMLDLEDSELTLGLRFGMSGRLIVDDTEPVDDWAYSSKDRRPEWNRFVVRFADGGAMAMQDPRRLGGVELVDDLSHIGPDARSLTLKQLRDALGTSTVALKARLMDQKRVAGVGNLVADEFLWRAGLDPARPAKSLTDDEVRTLHRSLRSTFEMIIKRGGSHTGDLQSERHREGVCPKDGTPLLRRTIGGRTTYSCPVHQV